MRGFLRGRTSSWTRPSRAPHFPLDPWPQAPSCSEPTHPQLLVTKNENHIDRTSSQGLQAKRLKAALSPTSENFGRQNQSQVTKPGSERLPKVTQRIRADASPV